MSAPDNGTVLAGKYRVNKLLGEGGMGLVIEAEHLQLEQRVAIKFLRPEALAHTSLVARFAREARAMTRIKSEHVARVIDVGTLETGAPYMVMEYLEGKDLEAVVAERGPQPIDKAVDLVLQASEALAEAHTLGIIHRDLKPANLFLTTRADGSDCVKVLDFGISKSRDTGSSTPDVALTQTASILGSPMYMAPEQMLSAKEVDVRTDIWALGTILFELLTGSPPFPGDTIEELRARMLTGKHLELKAFRDDIPLELEEVVLKCMQTDPNNRFSDLAELATALAPFAPPDAIVSIDRIRRLLAPKGSDAPASIATPYGRTAVAPSGSATPRSATPQSVPVFSTPVSARAPASSKVRWVGVAVAVLVLAALGIAVLSRADGKAVTGSPASPTASTVAVAEPVPAPPPSAADPVAPASAETIAAPPPVVASGPAPTGKTGLSGRTPIARDKTPRTSPTTEQTAPPPPPPATTSQDLFNTRK
ncbi:MAG: serine/threonine protein kinase [Deltaproteobacteria bacterium]|nr:serine/threonine protein kinase [Deltaproteobacteria bacterium]